MSKEPNRISLTFGDSPEEVFALALLRSKGRKKAVYVARCITAYERKRRGESSTVTPASVDMLKALLEQIISSAASEKAEPCEEPQSLPPQQTNPSPVGQPPDDELDDDIINQALAGLNAFDF